MVTVKRLFEGNVPDFLIPGAIQPAILGAPIRGANGTHFLIFSGTQPHHAGLNRHAAKAATQPRRNIMITRILAVTAFSLGLGTAAIAQTTMPSWDSTIKGAFFSDPNAGTLKTQEEFKTGWASLSAEQQAQVRTDCQTVTASASGSGTTTGTATTTTPSTGTDTTASGTTGTATTGTDTMASGSTGTGSATTTTPSTGTDTTASGTTTDTGTTASTTTDGSAGTSASGTTPAAGDTAAQMASMSQLCSWVEGM